MQVRRLKRRATLWDNGIELGKSDKLQFVAGLLKRLTGQLMSDKLSLSDINWPIPYFNAIALWETVSMWQQNMSLLTVRKVLNGSRLRTLDRILLVVPIEKPAHFHTTSAILKFTFLPFSFSVPNGFRMKLSSKACMVFSLMTIWPG